MRVSAEEELELSARTHILEDTYISLAHGSRAQAPDSSTDDNHLSKDEGA